MSPCSLKLIGEHINIDYDAKPNESSIQGLWGELQHRISSIPLIGLQTGSLATGQTGDNIFNSTPINPDLDDAEQLTGESIQSFLTLVAQLQWLLALGTHTHTHTNHIYLYILLCMSAQQHVTSTTRKE